MKKSEFVYVSPKNKVSEEIFDTLMYKLHACKVIRRENDIIFVKSITNNYNFFLKEVGDPNWEILKNR